MKKKLESDILDLRLLRDPSSRYLAEIRLQSGQLQRPTWRGLYRYWQYAKNSEVEYMAVSYTGHFVVFCMTVASGQGGIVSVWNTFRKRWEHVSEASHIICAMLLSKIPAILSFHYIARWGTPGNHSLYVTPMDRTRDGFSEISFPVMTDHSKKGLDLKSIKIKQSAYGDYLENSYGPLGIFLIDDDRSIFAHDNGNLYHTSINKIEKALLKL